MKLLIPVLCFAAATSAQLPDSPKPWLNRQTIAQLAIVGAAYSFDAMSSEARAAWTRSSRGELNPLVGHGQVKTGIYFGSAFAATVGASYVLRNHNRWRWTATAALSGLEFLMAYRNYQGAHYARRVYAGCVATPQHVSCPR